MEADLAALVTFVQSADLPFDARRTVLWCLAHLPQALERLRQTYESRYGDEVIRLERALLSTLQACAPQTADAVHDLLRALHERFGFSVPPDVPSIAVRKPRKKSA